MRESVNTPTQPPELSNKGRRVIAISGESYEKFLGLVDPLIIGSMIHKLPTKRLRPPPLL